LAIGLGTLVAVVLAQATIVGATINHLQSTDQDDDEARAEVFQYAVVVEAADDQQASLQAGRLGGGPPAVAAFSEAQARFLAGIPRLRQLAADDGPAMRARVEDAIRQEAAWNREVAAPQMAALRAGRRPAADAPLGQARLEALRSDFAYLRKHELDLLESRDHVWGEAFSNGRLTLLLGSSVAVLLAGGLGWSSYKRLVAQQAAARDASDRMAKALERATASERAKTIFLANMSHEMLTPLNGVLGMAAALDMTSLNPKQHDMLGVIRNAAADLEGLIGNLLTLSRGNAIEGKRTTDWAFHLGDEMRVVAEDYAAAAQTKGLRFSVDVPPEAEVRVRGDAARLERVLTCLLSNAVKFTDRGEVRLGVIRLAGDAYRFEVSDTGVGFDEAQKESLFATFTQSDDSSTRRFGGAGVGLAVASKIAADLGGRLDGHSRPDVGSRFTFEVDLAAAGPAPAPVSQTAHPARAVAGPAWVRPATSAPPRA
jgi:signal transduction histidine kinase